MYVCNFSVIVAYSSSSVSGPPADISVLSGSDLVPPVCIDFESGGVCQRNHLLILTIMLTKSNPSLRITSILQRFPMAPIRHSIIHKQRHQNLPPSKVLPKTQVLAQRPPTLTVPGNTVPYLSPIRARMLHQSLLSHIIAVVPSSQRQSIIPLQRVQSLLPPQRSDRLMPGLRAFGGAEGGTTWSG